MPEKRGADTAFDHLALVSKEPSGASPRAGDIEPSLYAGGIPIKHPLADGANGVFAFLDHALSVGGVIGVCQVSYRR